MWEVVSVPVMKTNELNQVLHKGYEPFAVTTDKAGWERIWLKREVSVTILLKKGTEETTKNEIHNKPSKPRQRRSRKNTTTKEG